jgi:hypothetical protein
MRKEGRKNSPLRMFLLSFCLCALIFSAVGGSLAWLMAETDPVVNVFTYGNIKIDLKETTGDHYKMTPGKELAKDPRLTVKADSENCWLFVKIEESTDKALSDFVEYQVADGWIALANTTGVYYREVNAADEDVSFPVIKDDKVKVKGSVTQEMLEQLNDQNYPKLTITGYAVQRDAEIAEVDTAAEAWNLIVNK